MSLLARDDPAYGLAYYQAVGLDPSVVNVVSKPLVNNGSENQNYSPFRPQHPSNRPPPNGYSAMSHAAPPAAQQQQQPRNAPPTVPRSGEYICWGCGERGHGIYACEAVNNMIRHGELTKDRAGRITRPNGSWIRKIGDEMLLQALSREGKVQAHFVVASENESGRSEAKTKYELKPADLGSDDESGGVFAVRDFSFATDRPEKQIAAKRKQVLEGVYPPRLRDVVGKENQPVVNKETGCPVRGVRGGAPQTVQREHEN